MKLVAIPDLHVPKHNRRAVGAVLDFLSDHPPDVFVQLGDLLDFEALSTHPRYEERIWTLREEFDQANGLLDQFDDVLPKGCKKHLLEGNHEDRLKRLLLNPPARQIEAFRGLTDVPTELKLEERGYQWKEYGELLKVGKAYFTHGWSAAKTHSSVLSSQAQVSLFYGHTHDVQMFTSYSLKGFPRMTASLGCLCDLDAKYLRGRPSKWVHGFGYFEFWGNGFFSFHPIVMVGGRFVWGGKRYG